jgi:hypothetical protein
LCILIKTAAASLATFLLFCFNSANSGEHADTFARVKSRKHQNLSTHFSTKTVMVEKLQIRLQFLGPLQFSFVNNKRYQYQLIANYDTVFKF